MSIWTESKAEQLGVSVDDVFNTMQVYLGSYYVNDFKPIRACVSGARTGGRTLQS